MSTNINEEEAEEVNNDNNGNGSRTSGDPKAGDMAPAGLYNELRFKTYPPNPHHGRTSSFGPTSWPDRDSKTLPMRIGIQGVGTVFVGYFQKKDWNAEVITPWLQEIADTTLSLWSLFKHLEPDLSRAWRERKIIGPNEIFTELVFHDFRAARKAIANPSKVRSFVEKFKKDQAKKSAKTQSAEAENREENVDEFRSRTEQQYADIDDGFPDPMQKDAFYGIASEVVGIIAPESEACREALLAQFLIAMGSLIGHGAYMLQAGWHSLNDYVAIVGITGRGRKGTGWRATTNLLESIDPDWLATRVIGGIPSGEAIIENVRDASEILARAKSMGKEPRTISDPGVEDKRLLLMEEEFRRLLSAGGRTTIPYSMLCAWHGTIPRSYITPPSIVR